MQDTQSELPAPGISLAEPRVIAGIWGVNQPDVFLFPDTVNIILEEFDR